MAELGSKADVHVIHSMEDFVGRLSEEVSQLRALQSKGTAGTRKLVAASVAAYIEQNMHLFNAAAGLGERDGRNSPTLRITGATMETGFTIGADAGLHPPRAASPDAGSQLQQGGGPGSIGGDATAPLYAPDGDVRSHRASLWGSEPTGGAYVTRQASRARPKVGWSQWSP